MIFYLGEVRQLLSEFKGARLDIGAEGSGTRLLALALLKARSYASGKTFLYRTFPFWVASLIARTLAVLIPIWLLQIPGIRIAPRRRAELLKKLDDIEASVNRIVVPASFGDLFYGLRAHVTFVRNSLLAETTPAAAVTAAEDASRPSS